MSERSAEVMINGQVYELILTTKATKEIAKKYGQDNSGGFVNAILGKIVKLGGQNS